MNISYNWLKRYIDTDLGAEEVARILTDIGLEVEGFEKIETIKGGLAGVVVGEVLTCEEHPDSDHLHVTTVDVGTGEPLQIVCGAPNCRAGLKVLCATVGTVLYPGGGDEEFKIKRSKIRGVESLGMLCAEDELGIGASHDGIMELPADAVAGTTARDYLRIEDDYLIEVGLTPNRVDAASHIGVARDLAAYLRSRGEDVSVKMPDVSAFAPDNHDLGVKIRVENHEAAPRYAGVTVKNCKIAPSPEWMQNCLRAAGINPKNNLVDITNFVLFELGQPLHAFDAAKIEGREVVVRTCAEGTPFVTLDGVERKLTADDLMICSAERPMCIAGVFGGLDSGISDTTTDVFIESAYFNPVWVRKTAKRFGLNTDSSFRFERGVDPNMQVYAAKRAALLMKELAGGEISSDITDIYPAPIEDFRFDVSFARIDALIGKHIPEETVRAILAALEVKVLDEKDGVLSVAVPPYRVDVQPQAASFFTLRAVAEKLLRRFGIDIYALKTETLQSDLFGEALTMALNGRELLQIGTVSRNIRRKLDVKQDVFYLEMNFEALVKSTKKHRIVAEELSKFPEVKRDLALLVDKQVTFSALRDVAFATERKLLKSVSLFDVYEGDKLPEGKKSYALSFILEDKTRTLDEKAIERAMQNLTAQFERQCGAHVRA